MSIGRTGTRLADIALEVCREQGRLYVWYGNPQLCHDIYDRSGRTQGAHPLNVIASVVSACAKSSKWRSVGYITHLGRKYPVYEMKEHLNDRTN